MGGLELPDGAVIPEEVRVADMSHGKASDNGYCGVGTMVVKY